MLTLCSRRQRFICILFSALIISVHTLVYVSQNWYRFRNFIPYLTRPVWDTPDGPTNIIPHYYTEGLPLDQYMCSLHGWKERTEEGERTVQVLDAVLMSSELDLLEIRLNELDSVVDWFFIVESNATFTGLPKEKYYLNNAERFQKFAHKIKYRSFDEQSVPRPWTNEARTRDAMTSLLNAHIAQYPSTDSLVIMSDVDEIPSAHTIRLLKYCDFGRSIHLQLRNYVYR
ncbi:hypothetical protein PQX77_004705 [Marasmius sp. AFHP31]|nr:hypothetical protein PQX77_004705 [Marasmius sp. AFHP31]